MADRSKRTIYVGGLPPDANETQLAHAFSVFGPVIEAAEDAIDNMHLNEWGSKILNVNFARPLGSTFNSHRPVWQDEEWIAKYGASLTRQEDAPQQDVEAVPTAGPPNSAPPAEAE